MNSLQEYPTHELYEENTELVRMETDDGKYRYRWRNRDTGAQGLTDAEDDFLDARGLAILDSNNPHSFLFCGGTMTIRPR